MAKRYRTNLKFFTKRALHGRDVLAEVVCWPQIALRQSTQCGEARDVPIDFRCYILPTATHTLATVVGDDEGLLDRAIRRGRGGWVSMDWRWCSSAMRCVVEDARANTWLGESSRRNADSGARLRGGEGRRDGRSLVVGEERYSM